LVTDLPVFLWWRAAPRFDDEVFVNFCRQADRVIVDCGRSTRPHDDIGALAAFLRSDVGADVALSDLDWARLARWRAQVASFYDIREHREALARLNRVSIEYFAPDKAPGHLAPQALWLAGWLASRLGWRPVAGPAETAGGARAALLEKDGRRMEVIFQAVERCDPMRGAILRIELTAENHRPAIFAVSCSEDGRHLETSVSASKIGHTCVYEDTSEARLLARALEVLSRDRVYEEAVIAAADLLAASGM
jgi:glucose-6-phosphate dehydrogenase assembly protein OpcA